MTRFRDKMMRQNYDAMVLMYKTKHPNLFRPDGSECHGNSFAGFFWKGFHGLREQMNWNQASRKMIGYACFCAGEDCAKGK